MLQKSSIIFCLALAVPLPGSARAQPSDRPNTLSLSDAEKADLLSQDTEASVDAARQGLGGSSVPDHAIHGEIGVLAGSHGTRATYGTATVPLGAGSQANVSFESSRSNRPY
jgi:hypothetical protein